MKIITKLLFVALLIGVALSLPSRVRAGSGTEGWTCNWSAYGACYTTLQQWMAECTRDCSEDGGGSDFICYDAYEPYEYYDNGVLVVVPYWTQDCENVPATGATCIQGCVSQYNSQYESCLTNNCTEE